MVYFQYALSPEARDEKHSKLMSKHDGSFIGEEAEKKVFTKLKSFFEQSAFRNVTIFSGWEDKGIFKNGKSREFDFFVVSGEAKKVIHIEAKRTNNDKKSKTKNLTPLEDATKQLQEGYLFLKDKTPFSEGWEFVSVVYFEFDEKKTKHDFILGPNSSFGKFFEIHLKPSSCGADYDSYKVMYVSTLINFAKKQE